MEAMEVIDLSSDDEKPPPKKQDTKSLVENETKAIDHNDANCDDVQVVYNTIEKRRRNLDGAEEDYARNKKLKLSKDTKQSDSSANSSEKSEIVLHKRIKPTTLSPQFVHRPLKSESGTLNLQERSHSLKKNGNLSESYDLHSGVERESPNTTKQSFKINEGASSSSEVIKPKLSVKTKIQVPENSETSINPSEEVLTVFLDVCRRQDQSKDMKKIIAKLRKKYNNLHPSYSKSGSFIELIRRKTGLIVEKPAKLFVHIAEVLDEMNARQIKSEKAVENAPKENSEQEEMSLSEDAKENRQLRALEIAMRRCRRKITKCEMAEVDFDDENDSYYIMAEKYKQRMVDLYTKYCEITDEKPDAGRVYLRPKNLSVTALKPLNDAINSFINKKIIKMHKSSVYTKKKSGRLALTDALLFPDYVDILSCIKKCNEEHDLKLSKTRQESLAKTAFGELGRLLQRYRQQDYWETFSIFLDEQDGDPALEDQRLAEKLSHNEAIGRKKLDAVFQEFVEKQFNESTPKVEDADEPGLDEALSEATEDEDSDTSEDSISIQENTDSDASDTESIHAELEKDVRQQGNDNGGLDNSTNGKTKTTKTELCQNSSHIPLLEKTDGNSNSSENVATDTIKLPADKVIDTVEEVTVEKTSEKIPSTLVQEKEVNNVAGDGSKISQVTTNDVESKNSDGTITLPSTVEKSVPYTNQEIKGMEITTPSNSDLPIVKTKPDNTAIPSPSIDRKLVFTNSKAIGIADGVNPASPPTQVRKLLSVDQITDHSYVARLGSPPTPIKEVTPVVTTCEVAKLDSLLSPVKQVVATSKVNLTRATGTPDKNQNDKDPPKTPAVETKVIRAEAEAPVFELSDEEEEKKPILRLRQFAKPPGSWKDFQSPTKDRMTGNRTTGEKKQANSLSPSLDLKTKRCVQVKVKSPVGRTVQVKHDIIANLKNKSSTIIIPNNLHRNNPQINVNTITNNVTLNLTNPTQLKLNAQTVAPQGTHPLRGHISIDKSGQVSTHCASVGVLGSSNQRDIVTQISNTNEKVESSSQQQRLVVKNPSNHVRQFLQQSSGVNQPRFKILTQSSGGQRSAVVQNVPIVIDECKKTIYRIVNRSSGAICRTTVQPTPRAVVVQNRTARNATLGSGSDSSIVNTPDLKLKVTDVNCSKKTIPVNMPQQSADTLANNVYEKPTHGVPTFVIE